MLKDLLVELIKRDPLSNPLQDEHILVQSPGMAQWLRLQLADDIGIAAAINFPLPASFLWDMYLSILPDVPKRSFFNKESMTWHIMSLMKTFINQDSFTPLKNYLINDADNLKCYQLAGKIADIFDQYLVYRPEWIIKWENGDNLEAITQDQQWQPKLWRALVKRIKQLGHSHWHRANMHQQFNDVLLKEYSRKKLPQRLFVFGISALPPHFVESLQSLGQQIDIHLMINNPCRYFWGGLEDPKYRAKMAARRFTLSQQNTERSTSFLKSDLETNKCTNTLLASMGKLGRDYLYQLHDIEAVDIDAFANVPRTSLLSHIQADILDLLDSTYASDKQVIASNDSSLAIHSCHSPLREVEVLHDQLLSLFDHNADITPKDIIVMLPDIDAYSPWIHAAFGSMPQDDARYIPYSISDGSARVQHPILSGVLRLLELNTSRCTAPELLELLEIPAIQRRFKLNQARLNTLKQWINEAGIRWGINQQQAAFGLPVMAINTWLFGLKRMLLGYAMPEASGLYEGILPLDSIQGMDAALSGQLADFIDCLEQVAESLNTPRCIGDWIHYLNHMLEQFFQPEEEDEYALKSVRDAMKQLHEQLKDADYSEPLSKAVFIHYLTDHISQTRSSQRFLAGQVNFCTLMPMRSIPFKVVCLLGMNDGAYPRSIIPTGFDLIAQNSRRGDRSRREDDRYLFLEALLSAEQRLYISYVGKSIQDNSTKAPSVLVTELLNYCEQGFILASNSKLSLKSHLITEHPLQAFSVEIFKPDNNKKLFSYAKQWLPSAARQGIKAPFFMGRSLTQAEQPEHLELPELIRFFKEPCKYFCNRRLKVFFDKPSDILEEDEPFILTGLEQYQIKQDILDHLIKEENPASLLPLQRAKGTLPYGAFGELSMGKQLNTVTSIANYVTAWITHSTLKEDEEINLTIGNTYLSGWLKQSFSSGLLRYRAAPIKGKDIITGWLEHLCYCAMGNKLKTTLVGIDAEKDLTLTHCFQPLSATQAIKYLSELIEIYIEGISKPLPFFIETAFVWFEERQDKNKAYKKAKLKFEGNTFVSNNFSEGADPYIARIYPNFDEIYDSMLLLSKRILAPAITHTIDQ